MARRREGTKGAFFDAVRRKSAFFLAAAPAFTPFAYNENIIVHSVRKVNRRQADLTICTLFFNPLCYNVFYSMLGCFALYGTPESRSAVCRLCEAAGTAEFKEEKGG
jgi:hypothetical protein